ncbi:hypothetical protein [Rhizobium sp. LjRoot254]|uniref:hypothetical protein n=1 Tax=Rhizobium sp. LjRoot254 TaxID=3342297 RepID=UPI003ECD7535
MAVYQGAVAKGRPSSLAPTKEDILSSTIQQHFTLDDLNMLRRVLDNAGLHDRHGETSHSARLAASRFLIGCFKQGISTEMELRFELFHHLYQDMSERVRAGELADIKAWENEGGALASEARPTRQPMRLVSSHATVVRRIMLGFPAFSPSDNSSGADDAIPQMLTMAA